MMNDDRDDDQRPLEITPEDSLDDESRRELLKKLARVGAAAIPVSVVLLDATEAHACPFCPRDGNPTTGIAWGS